MPTLCVAGKMPAVFINHGGGPLPLLGAHLLFLIEQPRSPTADAREMTGANPTIANFCRSYPATLAEPPKAILVVTAHWQQSVPTVSTSETHTLLFDYGGFPAETQAGGAQLTRSLSFVGRRGKTVAPWSGLVCVCR